MKFGFAKWGWTEHVWWFGDDLDSFQADATMLVSSRRTWLCTSCDLERAMCQITDDNGNPFQFGPQPPMSSPDSLTGPGPGLAQGTILPIWIALLSEITSAESETLRHRREYLSRGQTTTMNPWTETHPVSAPIPIDLRDKAKDYVQQLTQAAFMGLPFNDANETLGRWCDRGVPLDPALRVVKKLTKVDVFSPTDSRWRVDFEPGIILAKGDTLHIHGVGGAGTRGINGDHIVDDFDGGDTILRSKQLCPCPIDWNKKGTCWKVFYNLFPIINFRFWRNVRKSTGLPFYGTRGRRRSKRCNQG